MTCRCSDVSYWGAVLRVSVFCAILCGFSYVVATYLHKFSDELEAELKYWRAAHPAEHAIAKQNGFKVEAETGACLECW